MSSYFLIGMILSMRGGLTANNICGTVLLCIFMTFPVYGLYVNLSRPYMFIFSADENKLFLKSFLKTRTLFVEDIKLLEVREGGKFPMCNLHTEKDSFCFYIFEEFYDFVEQLRKKNPSFILKE